jgi:RNA polymerase sigma factor (sigma-70 family)
MEPRTDNTVLPAAPGGGEIKLDLSWPQLRCLIEAAVRRHYIREHDRDDFTQDCWIAVSKACAGYRGGSVRRFVAVIVDCQAKNYFRQIRAHARFLEGMTRKVGASEQERSIPVESVLEVRRSLERLDTRERRITQMHDMEGFTVAQAAEVLGIPAAQGYILREKAMKRLLHRLELPPPPTTRKRGALYVFLFIILPCAFVVACTAALLRSSFLERWVREAGEFLYCLARNTPFENIALDPRNLPCPQRDRDYLRFAVHTTEHRQLVIDSFSLLQDHSRGEQSSAVLRYADLLQSVGISEQYSMSLYETMRSAHEAFQAPSFLQGVTPELPPTTQGHRGVATAATPPRSLVLEGLSVNFCNNDVGWELGCDEQEISIAWMTVGEGYFACGVSSTVTGVSAEAPYEGRIELPAHVEVGIQPENVHLFVDVVEIDTGGASTDAMRQAVCLAATAAYTLKGSEYQDISPSLAADLRSLLTFVLRLSASENDVHESVDIAGSAGGVYDIELPHWPEGAFSFRLRAM